MSHLVRFPSFFQVAQAPSEMLGAVTCYNRGACAREGGYSAPVYPATRMHLCTTEGWALGAQPECGRESLDSAPCRRSQLESCAQNPGVCHWRCRRRLQSSQSASGGLHRGFPTPPPSIDISIFLTLSNHFGLTPPPSGKWKVALYLPLPRQR